MSVELPEDRRGTPGTFRGELLELRAPGADQRELRRDEDTVDRDQDEQQDEQDGAHRRPPVRQRVVGWIAHAPIGRAYFEGGRRRSLATSQGYRTPDGVCAAACVAANATSAADQASASTFFASSKSFSVSPPSEWVEIATSTWLQEIAMSGWWLISSAGADERVDELDRADEVAAIEALDDVLAPLTPAVEALEPLLDLLVAQKCHIRRVRIASLVPSATEMLFALGLGDQVVAVTHECDYPPEAAGKPSSDPEPGPAAGTRAGRGEIDAEVRRLTGEGRHLYELDEPTLARARRRPDRHPGRLRGLRRLLRRRRRRGRPAADAGRG